MAFPRGSRFRRLTFNGPFLKKPMDVPLPNGLTLGVVRMTKEF
jgi:hypothetical protein